ncbi:MAG TPA: hypothetical protein VMN37_07190 [Gemmatimonadales bacterium]|nr:hypothetical protein [Gemmatimonadales bacterium]
MLLLEGLDQRRGHRRAPDHNPAQRLDPGATVAQMAQHPLPDRRHPVPAWMSP